MTIDPQLAANYSIGGVVISGSVFWVLRWVIRTFHVDKLANKMTNAESNVIDRLEKEIVRLEAIISMQNEDHENAHKAFLILERKLAARQADLFTIRAIMDGACVCDKPAKRRILGLISKSIDEDNLLLESLEEGK